MTIVRGNLTAIWGVFLIRDLDVQVIVDIEIKNEGYLNINQDHNLSLNFLKGFLNLNNYLLHEKFKG
jgi:hypothetical protein